MLTLKITTVGSSTGVVLPKEALARLNVQKGDRLFLVETKHGYELTAFNAEFHAQMQAAEQGMRRYRNALQELAKEEDNIKPKTSH